MSDLQMETMVITPELATVLLETNQDNRKVRPQVVERYARDMKNGVWTLNGESIKITADGILNDGQHRLLGCVAAATPFETVVIRGVSFESRDSMDTGARRNLADILRWNGEVAAAALAASIEAGLCWDERGIPTSNGTAHSNAERLAWLEANGDIRDAIRAVTNFSSSPFKFPASASAPFYMRAHRLAPDEATAFMHSVRTGADLGEHHPIAKFRTWLFRTGAAKGRVGREEYAALAVKTWNAWLKGAETKHLSWRRGGVSPEEFPFMYGPDGRTYEDTLTAPVAALPEILLPGLR